MYCIFHLPRTGSRYLHSLINSSLILLDPRHHNTDLEPFNPSRNTVEQIEKKYNTFVNSTPKVTVKMVINHYPNIADKFINNPDYTTIFIKPKHYRKRLLKALVEKHCNTFSNGTDRKQIRESLVGTLCFSDELIIERFNHYKIHMEYEQQCDHVFYDEDIFSNPNNIMNILNLPIVSTKYKRVPPYYSDEQMLTNVEKFNEQYDSISIKLFGKVI